MDFRLYSLQLGLWQARLARLAAGRACRLPARLYRLSARLYRLSARLYRLSARLCKAVIQDIIKAYVDIRLWGLSI